MQQKKRSKKKIVREYSPESLMFRSIAGIILIALGVLAAVSVLAGLRGSAFDLVRNMMHGLGGIGCLGIPVFLIWAGVVLSFSAHRSMPVRALYLLFVVYLCLLAMINLMSKVVDTGFMDYVVRYNERIPIPEANSFSNMIKTTYQFSAQSSSFGGALGLLLGWVAWNYFGLTAGMVVVSIVALVCIMFVSRFDLVGWLRAMKDTTDEALDSREEKRRLREQEELRRKRAESEAKKGVPAFIRRGRKDASDPEEAPPSMPQQTLLGPDGQLYTILPNGMPVLAGPQMMQGGMHGFPPMPVPVAPNGQPVQLYDEMVYTPAQNETPLWQKSSAAKSRVKSTATTSPVAGATAHQTEMVFTPGEVGENWKPPKDKASKKVSQHMEEIMRRKLELEKQLGGQPLPVDRGPESAPVAAHTGVGPAASAGTDKAESYKRPLIPATGPATPFMSGQRLDTPNLVLPDTAKAQQAAQAKAVQPYVYPMLELLNNTQQKRPDTRIQDTENAGRLERTLESFGIPARVQRVTHGPAITRFELGLISSGINVKRIMSIADNIALEMAANGGVRIEIPIPGTNLFGIEIPNKEITSVTLAEVLTSQEMAAAKSPLTVALGRDIAGKPILCDLARMPHLLIAGQTGSGKSVCINTIINSILFRSPPEEVRMIMIDPKVVELQSYNVVPHLLIPVVSDPHKAAGALQWAVAEMLDRYHKMQSKSVRELSAYNEKLGPDEEKLPRIIIVIDELADLMLACKKEVEESIIRIAQLARAAGIHMIVATQRPTVDVITGLIKANIPSRIAFAVSSSIDSRTILDMNGAEKLLGRGDMFYFPTGASTPTRVQGCFLSDGEIERVVGYIGSHSHVEFDPNVIEALSASEEPISGLDDMGDGGVDDKLQEAIEMVISDGQASISMLQRRMKIGYARAGRLIDDMANRGIVSKSTGSKPREVLMSFEEYERIKDSLLR